MAEFVRAQIFGTTFEITSRCLTPTPAELNLAEEGWCIFDNFLDIPTSNPWAWERSDLYGMGPGINRGCKHVTESYRFSSAKDQLTNQAVAVKKIMKPFSTPVLSKRTYRELKLLKHLRHENVTD